MSSAHSRSQRDPLRYVGHEVFEDVEKYVRARWRRFGRLPVQDREDLLSSVVTATLAAMQSRQALPRVSGAPSPEDELGIAKRYAKTVAAGMFADLAERVRRSSGLTAIVNAADAVPLDDDLHGGGQREDALIDALDAARGAAALTGSFELSEFWRDVDACCARQYQVRTGREWSPPAIRPKSRREIAASAPDVRTGALVAVLLGFKTSLPITTATTPADVVAAETEALRKALYRNRTECVARPVLHAASVDTGVRVDHERAEDHEAARRVEPLPPVRARAGRRGDPRAA